MVAFANDTMLAHQSTRLFLGQSISAVRWLQGTPLGDDNYVEKMVALGSHDTDCQTDRLSVLSLRLPGQGAPAGPPSLEWVASWRHTGRVTELQVVPPSGGNRNSLLVTSSSSGDIACMSVQVPQHRMPTDTRLNVDEGCLAPFQHPGDTSGEDTGERVVRPHLEGLHRGPGGATAMHVRPGTLQGASGGGDGCVYTYDLAASQPRATLMDTGAPGTRSIRGVRWLSDNLLVGACQGGEMLWWDVRQRRRVRHESGNWLKQVPGRGFINCIASPMEHYVILGCSGGYIAVADTRSHSVCQWSLFPVGGSPEAAEAAGDVWEVQVDPRSLGIGSAGQLNVIACTEGGTLEGLSLTKKGHRAELHAEMYAAIDTFDAETTQGKDIVCGTQNECLVYLKRA
eukprot:jgi/Mesvir1/21025/Mv08076-RA.1